MNSEGTVIPSKKQKVDAVDAIVRYSTYYFGVLNDLHLGYQQGNPGLRSIIQKLDKEWIQIENAHSQIDPQKFINHSSTMLCLDFVLKCYALIELRLTDASLLEWLTSALYCVQQNGGKSELCIIHKHLGSLYNELSLYDNSEYHYSIAIQVAQEVNDVQSQAEILAGLGLVYLRKGDRIRAADQLQNALKVSEVIQDKHTQCKTLLYLSEWYDLEGEKRRLEESLQDALKLSLAIADIRLEGQILNKISVIDAAKAKKDPKLIEKCLINLNKALQIARMFGDRKLEAQTLIPLTNIYLEEMQYQIAKPYCERALQLLLETNNKKGLALCYLNLGTIFHVFGDYRRAVENFNNGIPISIELDDKQLTADMVRKMMVCYSYLGKYAELIEAIKYFGMLAGRSQEDINKLIRFNTFAKIEFIE